MNWAPKTPKTAAFLEPCSIRAVCRAFLSCGVEGGHRRQDVCFQLGESGERRKDNKEFGDFTQLFSKEEALLPRPLG